MLASTPSNLLDRKSICLAFCVLSLTPFLFTALPPLTDLAGHMGRYHIMLSESSHSALQQYYEFHWTLMGNLGADLIVYAIGPWLGVERATWFISAIIPPLTVSGIFAICWALYEKAPPLTAFSFLFVYSYPFLYGFLNYTLGAALALHAFALWIRFAGTGPKMRACLGIASSAVIWICHAAAWGVLGLLVAGYEISRLSGWQTQPLANSVSFGRRIWAFTLPIIPMIMWWQEPPSTGFAQGADISWFTKFVWLASVLRDTNFIIDVSTIVIVICLLYWAARSKKVVWHKGLLTSACLLGAAYLIIPPVLMASFYADMRLVPVLFITLLLSVEKIDVSSRTKTWLVGCAYVLVATRLTLTIADFSHRNLDWKNYLRALDKIPERSRILTLYEWRCPETWRRARTENLSNMAIVRRDAFVNNQWSDGAHLLTVKYDAGYFSKAPSHLVYKDCNKPGVPDLSRLRYLIPLNRFDYVWLHHWSGHDFSWTGASTLIFSYNDSYLFKLDSTIAGEQRH